MKKKIKKFLVKGNIFNQDNRQNAGITLVALVITIILLLILAGITINTLSNTGIFEKAKEAREKYQNAQNEEEMQLAKYGNKIDSYVENARSESFTVTTLWQYDSTVSGDNVNSGRKTGEITLSNPITNFDEIVFFGQSYFSNGGYGQAMETRILTENLISNPPNNDGTNRAFLNTISVNDNRRMVYNLTSENKITIDEYNNYRLLNIKGIKY